MKVKVSVMSDSVTLWTTQSMEYRCICIYVCVYIYMHTHTRIRWY